MSVLQRPPSSTVVKILGAVCFFYFIIVSITHTADNGFSIWTSESNIKGHVLINDVYNSTLGFQKIFVISLPERTDHRDAIILAAAASGIEIEFVDGVMGASVLEKVIPPPASPQRTALGNIGSWRAHMNAIAEIIKQNLTTALILEDDADWDIRLRTQLHSFALAAHALTQPLASSNPHNPTYADPTFPTPPDSSTTIPNPLTINSLPQTHAPTRSPYGDNWDLLWLGHCGAAFPNPHVPPTYGFSTYQPRGRVLHQNDPTVPEWLHCKFLSADDPPNATYTPHTRVTHHVMGNICSLAYATTQESARRLLYTMTTAFTAPFDIMLREYCEGPHSLSPKNHLELRTCLTMQPQLFNHHRKAGKMSFESDISNHGDGVREVASTGMVRWSVRINLERIFGLVGLGVGENKAGEGWVDQWPDGEAGRTMEGFD
ncbi:MAG: hypothetical protein M1834_007255 [Cirrosporium novae-zelandiae]|nr:MAG: hypothetical protein M1834_007255 [Cirrosporium novae-zelandiae]